MKFLNILLVLLLLPTVVSAESYYLPPDDGVNPAYTLETETNSIFSRIKQGFSDSARSIFEVFAPLTSAVGGFFSALNYWVGEFIFLTRLFMWSAIFIIVNLVLVKFMQFMIVMGIKSYFLFKLMFEPETATKTIAEWSGNKVKMSTIKRDRGLSTAMSLLHVVKRL